MAKMIPDYGSNLEDYFDDYNKAEQKVYQALRDALPQEVIVIHSKQWISKDVYGKADGEADFIIIHPEYGIQVLEVKGGRIEYDPSTSKWFSVNRHDQRFKISDPFRQAMLSTKAFIGKWNEMIDPQYIKLPMAHGVCLPDVDQVQGILPQHADHNIIIYRSELFSDHVVKEINKVYEFYQNTYRGAKFDKNVFDRVVSFFNTSCSFKNSLKGDIEYGKVIIDKLTESQFKVLKQLGRNRKVAIDGGAGTGKTILAMKKAQMLKEENLKILLVCYNQQLAAHIKKNIDADVYTYHDLCIHLCEKVKDRAPHLIQQYRQGEQSKDQDFFLEMAPLLLSEANTYLETADRYDAIIVDEGQDFTNDWLDSLEELNRSGISYLFFDQNQDIYNRNLEIPENYFHFPLFQNLRNTQEIHNFSTRFITREDNESSEIAGQDIQLETFTSDKDEKLKKIINKLIINEEVPVGEIAVLSGNRVQKNINWDKLNTFPTTTHINESKDKILLNTIHSLKGIEKSVVILTNIDHFELESHLKLLYVAITRAKIQLIVLAQEETLVKLNLAEPAVKIAG